MSGTADVSGHMRARVAAQGGLGNAPLATFLAVVVATAVLYAGTELFLPLAIAMLLAFALSPLVSWLRRRGLSQALSAVTVMVSVGGVLAMLIWLIVVQLGHIASELPNYQSNVIGKLEQVRDSSSGSPAFERTIRMIEAIGAELEAREPAAGPGEIPEGEPVRVEVVEASDLKTMLRDMVMPVLGPLAVTGLIFVVATFMLIERDALRDRLIRLIGSNDINRSTRMLEEAGTRVSHYLLAQALVNLIYALPIALGLWALGVPYAVLFGLITFVLRFVPYIGTALSALLPLALAFAVSPGWQLVLWTAVLFVAVETVSSNFIEPWLYGSRTGLSPMAVIVSAMFWTWIWGPLGLLIATPLTVCLVVLGRHAPQLAVFNVMFGDEPVLSEPARLYQRFLAGDVHESTIRAEEAVEERFIAEYYRDVAIPALAMAQQDYDLGRMTALQEERISETALAVVQALEPMVAEEVALAEARATQPAAEEGADTPAGEADGIIGNGRLDGRGRRVAVVGGLSRLDQALAAMLAQAAASEGAAASEVAGGPELMAGISQLRAEPPDCVLLAYLDPTEVRAVQVQVRRVKRALPGARVGVLAWTVEAPEAAPGAAASPTVERAVAAGADFAETTLEAALAGAFVDAPSRPPVIPPKVRARLAAA